MMASIRALHIFHLTPTDVNFTSQPSRFMCGSNSILTFCCTRLGDLSSGTSRTPINLFGWWLLYYADSAIPVPRILKINCNLDPDTRSISSHYILRPNFLIHYSNRAHNFML